MPTYTADHYAATSQAVSDAIERSKSHNEIVDLECLADGTREAVSAELMRECEDSVNCNGVDEYWGADLDGNTWRVHVTMA